MANFEGLIRGALAAKGDATPEIRAQVYQSSRNALQRLIENNRSMTVETAVNEQQGLEEAIARIEASYLAPPPPPPAPAPAPEYEPEPAPRIADPEIQAAPQSQTETDPFFELQQVLGAEMSPRPEPAPNMQTPPPAQGAPVSQPAPPPQPAADAEDYADNDAIVQDAGPGDYSQGSRASFDDEVYVGDPPSVPVAFAKRRRSQKKVFWFFLVLVLLLVIGWIGYRILIGVIDGSLLGYNGNGNGSISGTSTQQDQESDYITVIEPGDLTAMVVSDRGRVEIINEQSLEMVRVLSLRDKNDRSQSAKPILLRLKPGVVQQIRGKRVTAEIFARSGSSGPAQFAVECVFDDQIGCGRKRFRVGVQPEASVFAFTMGRNTDINADAFIAVNTDITDDAAVTGEGDILDIVYVRLRTSRE